MYAIDFVHCLYAHKKTYRSAKMRYIFFFFNKQVSVKFGIQMQCELIVVAVVVVEAVRRHHTTASDAALFMVAVVVV